MQKSRQQRQPKKFSHKVAHRHIATTAKKHCPSTLAKKHQPTRHFTTETPQQDAAPTDKQPDAKSGSIFDDPRVYRSLNILGDCSLGWKRNPLSPDIYNDEEHFQKASNFLAEKHKKQDHYVTKGVSLDDLLESPIKAKFQEHQDKSAV